MECYLNGEWLDDSRAAVSIHDRGFLLGDGLFETMAVTQGTPEFLGRHLERLYTTADALKIFLPIGREEFAAKIAELPRRNGIAEGRLRLAISRGVPGAKGVIGAGDFEDDWRPTVLATISAMKIDRAFEPPYATRTLKSSQPCFSPDAASQGTKSASYLDKLHARDAARSAGAWDALLINTRGEVMELGTSNIFWLKHGVLHTPAVYSGCLPGVARRAIIEGAGDALNCEVREGLYRPDELDDADAVFATNSIMGVAPIARVDHRTFENANETIRLLGAAFRQALEEDRAG